MTTAGPLILGGSGHVGRALARIAPGPALWQQRGQAVAGAAAVSWDILRDPAPDLPHLSGVISLTRGADAQTEIALAKAACSLGERQGVPVLIASSQAVYGPGAGPMKESDPCAPATDYGRTKLAAEQAVAGRATCLRIGNVVGCDALLINAAKARVMLDRLPDGRSPRRAYVGPEVLWKVMMGLLAHRGPLPEVLNVAQPGLVAMADLLTEAGLGWDWTDGAGALAELALDVSLLQSLVPVPVATPSGLIAQARASGWVPA